MIAGVTSWVAISPDTHQLHVWGTILGWDAAEMQLGLAVAAGPDPHELADLVVEAESLGFESLWCNDHPAGDGLRQLAVWAERSSSTTLGVGALALDRHSPESIAQRVSDLGLGRDRTVLAIGAGFSQHPVRVVRDGVSRMRQLLPEVRLAVAAMGPRMCALAGEMADAVLLNWMTPERAAWARDHVAAGARDAGRALSDVKVYGYVRTALGDDAQLRLARESSMYGAMPHYARHYEAMGVDPALVGDAVTDASELPARLARYDALDIALVRVLSERSMHEVVKVARAAIGD